MKKHVIIATGLAVLSTSAYASKARMSALGQDAAYGSHYIQDTRNVFRNAAHVNTHTDYAIFEWGDTEYTFDPGDGELNGTFAEGGFFRSHGAFNYGVYLGNTIGMTEAGEVNGENFQEKQDVLDLFFGGDTGAIQWGANVHWASSKDEGPAGFDAEHSALGLGLGMIMGDLEAYVNYRFKDNHEGAEVGNDELERSIMLLGASYNLGNLTFFGSYYKADRDYTEAGVADAEAEHTVLQLGVGHTHEVSATSRLLTDLTFSVDKLEGTNLVSLGSTIVEKEDTTLRLNIGYEADATSWLTLRGSVNQNILIGTNETGTPSVKKSLDNSTTVNAGATLNFGSLKVDGMIGAGEGDAGSLSLGDNVMTQVAVHYWF